MAAPTSMSGVDEISKFFAAYFPKISLNPVASRDVIPVDAHSMGGQHITRNEVLMKLLVTCGGLVVSLGVTFVGFKYLLDAMDPTKKEKKEAHQRAERLMRKIGVEGVQLTDYELCIASNLVDPLSMVTSWNDIGGLESCIEEIQESVIMPFRNQKLFAQSSLLQPPKGVLLYGPPGCGKTMIAKATAKAAGARFINLQVSSLVDKWYGESQKRAEAVFSLALKLQPVIIFIDEIDSFLRSRTSTDHEATAMIKTQFMSFWDGLTTDARTRIIIMGATNRPSDVDAAILRRMPAMFHVTRPKKAQRQSILELVLRNENLAGDVDLSEIAGLTENYSGSDLKELCRNAALYCVRDYMQQQRGDGDAFHIAPEEQGDMQKLRPMSQADFTRAITKMRQNKTAQFGQFVDDVMECD